MKKSWQGNTLWGPATKVCAKCKKEKTLHEFAKANGNYPRSECKECGKKQEKIRKELNKLYKKPLPESGYCCPICTRTYEQIKNLGNRHGGWCIDHDHVTEKFRGFLCHDCNKALGFFKDNTKLLESAINYLKKNDKSI